MRTRSYVSLRCSCAAQRARAHPAAHLGLALAASPSASRFSLSAPARRASRSTNTARCAPRESASMPSAPVPANRSSTAAPSTSPSIENSASRTRSDVGRWSCPAAPSAACRRSVPRSRACDPRDVTAAALTRGSARSASAPNARCERVAEQRVLGRRAARVGGDRSPPPARARAPAAPRPRAGTRPRTGQTPTGGSRSARPPCAARRSISASWKPSACSTSARSRRAPGGPTAGSCERCSPRPTRPRSWCSWEIPKRSAFSTSITVAFGTSMPTSITVVATSTSASPEANSAIAALLLARAHLPVQQHQRDSPPARPSPAARSSAVAARSSLAGRSARARPAGRVPRARPRPPRSAGTRHTPAGLRQLLAQLLIGARPRSLARRRCASRSPAAPRQLAQALTSRSP